MDELSTARIKSKTVAAARKIQTFLNLTIHECCEVFTAAALVKYFPSEVIGAIRLD